MKKLTILLFSILISFNSYGEWTKLVEHPDGHSFYIGTDTIKKHGGYVYYWYMTDFLKPTEWGDMSVKTYYQGDCGVTRYKILSHIWYKQPMGGGIGETDNTPSEWEYPSPDSIAGLMLRYACAYVE